VTSSGSRRTANIGEPGDLCKHIPVGHGFLLTQTQVGGFVSALIGGVGVCADTSFGDERGLG
jgi:hypothetical protein